MEKLISKVFFFVLAIIVSTGIVSCGLKSPERVNFQNITEYKERTKVSIEGYLSLCHSFNYDRYSSCIHLRDADNENEVVVWIQHHKSSVDSEPNTMDPLPLWYESSDLVVWLDDGTQAGYGDKVTITGTLFFPDEKTPVISDVTKIER